MSGTCETARHVPPTRDDEPDFQIVQFGALVRRWRQAWLESASACGQGGLNQSSISRLERGRLPGLTLWRLLILELGGIVAPTNRIRAFNDR